MTYWGINPAHHASSDDKAPIPVFGIRLLSEIMCCKFPGVQGAVNVNSDNIEIRFRWLSVGI